MERVPRRRFTSEFKAEAVKLVTEQGLTQGEAARRLGISGKSLNKWVGQAKVGQLKGSPGADKLSFEQRRIKELERELAIARME
jgi:transposase